MGKEVILEFKSGSGGTYNYDALTNKPKINEITVEGEKEGKDYSLQNLLIPGEGIDIEDNGDHTATIKSKGSIDAYTKTETDTLLAEKADASAVYTKTAADALLDAKADKADTYTKQEVDALLPDMTDYYDKTETDTLLAEKAELSVASISTAGGGDEVHATVSQGDDAVSFNYYKTGATLPDYVNLSVDGDGFRLPTAGYVDKLDDAVPFVATYEQTTYADVTAAIDADRSIVVNFPANRNLICVTYSTYVPSQNVLMYGIFKSQNWVSLATITLTPANAWRVTHTKLQELLESGINIKTVNNQSLLGSGNIDVGGGAFVAAQNVTTHAEIVGAINAGNTIFVDFEVTEIGKTGRVLISEAYIVSKNTVYLNGYGADCIEYGFIVHPDNSWEIAPQGLTYAQRTDDIFRLGYRFRFNYPVDGVFDVHFNRDSGGGLLTDKVAMEFAEMTTELPTTEYTGDLSALTTDNKTNLVSAINEVYEKSGEPFRVKNWANSSLNVSIPYCTEEVANTSIAKMTYSIDAEEGASYQMVGMIAYEVFDSSNQRINCWPVCQFTGNGQKELSVRWACMGSSRKTATKINAWVLLKHR